MGAREWLTIALFVLSAIGGVVWFLIRRFLRTVDTLHQALYGEKGLYAQLAQYVKREQHDVANAELAAQMDKMRIEAGQREGRILESIERHADRSRTEVSKLGDRIDRIRDAPRENASRRGS